MRLKLARVTNFRSAEDSSVEDSQPFSLDQVTCLVGKNESGKTAVLEAIAGLNPHPATPFAYSKERDYPRRFLSRYDQRHPDEKAVVITTWWEITEAEKKEISDLFGPNAVTAEPVQILRRYEAKEPEWTLPIDWAKAIQHLIDEAGFNAAEKSQVKAPTNSKTLLEALAAIESPNPKHQALRGQIESYPSQSVSGKVRKILQAGFPRFMYFSHYDRMSGEVQLEQLKSRRDDGTLESDDNLISDRLYYEFLKYAGASLDEILAASTYESFTSKLQSASITITDEILPYWSQNPDISVGVTVDAAKPGDPPPFNSGTIGRARIVNNLHRVDGPFGERSAGFIWFFSFLIKFAQVKNDSTPVVLLLDEPGLSLHGKAQADLLRYFEEKLAPHHQIIYSTHSPFMVQPDKLTSARIVDDLVVIDSNGRRRPRGTKVRKDVLSTDPDSIFPLQGALGYEITQTLFIGKHTLLVEGVSDILYLKAFSAVLAKRRRHALDPKWTICPCGGIGNIRPFVSLFKGNDLNIVVVSDYVPGQKRQVATLKESDILKAGAVLTLDQFTGKSEADVEDLFEADLFVELLNKAYDLKGEHILTPDELEEADSSTPRLVKKAEAYFRTLPDSIPVFDHYRPSEWLVENPGFLEADEDAIKKTLDRAESLFDAINPLLF